MVFELFLGLFAGVFGIIVLLIYDALRRFAVMGKAFLKFIIQYLMQNSASILPSILHAYPGPSQSMQPYSIIDPPPNFTVPSISLLLSLSPALFKPISYHLTQDD